MPIRKTTNFLSEISTFFRKEIMHNTAFSEKIICT